MVYFLIPGLYIFLGLILLISYLLLKNNRHFELRGVPFIKPLLFYGNVKERLLFKKSFHEFHKDMYFHFKGNPYYGIFEGTSPILMLADLDLIKNALVKDFDHFVDRPAVKFKDVNPYNNKMILFIKGNEWKQVRSAITPAFSSGRLKAMTEIENKCGIQFVNHVMELINENGGTSANIDIKGTMGKFTLDVIANTAFGVELDCKPDSEMSKIIAKFNDISKVTRFVLLSALFMQLPSFINRLIPISFFNEESMNYIAEIIKDVMKQRKEKTIRRNDLLQLLIDAQSATLTEEGYPEVKSEKGFVLSEEMVIAQSILFFIAGFETTGTVLTMLCYELAQNPEIQEKLRDEVFEKLKTSNGEISYEMINDMPYLDMAMSETLRKYPPVARTERMCVKDYKLQNIEIKAGEKIGVPVYSIHMDPEYYPEPEKFRPERFHKEEKNKRHQFTYLPFGAGPRNCIGLRSAQIAVKICMVHLMKQFKLDVCENTKIPFEFHKGSVLLKAKENIVLKMSKLV